MPTRNYNFVTFRPAGTDDRLHLTLEGDWTITGGFDADVNSATTKHTEIAKLPANPTYVSGAIEFWFTADPDAEPAEGEAAGEPDVVRDGYQIVDLVPDLVARAPGQTTAYIERYRLAFADHRQAFREPRGGRLMRGLVNSDQLPPGQLLTTQTLVGECLDAMGVPADLPTSLNAFPPPRNLQWLGAHAPSELAGLLARSGHAYCCSSQGLGYVVRVGVGDLPAIPAELLEEGVIAAASTRLPTKAIFTSFPNAVIRTFDEEIPTAPQVGRPKRPEWKYVVRNWDDYYKWVPIEVMLNDPEMEVRKGFPSVPPQHRPTISEDAFRVIRLASDRFDPRQCPVLREVIYPNGEIDAPHLIVDVAVQGRSGGWTNQEDVRINAETVDGSGNLLVFPRRIGGVTNGKAADFDPFFEPVPEETLKPSFSVEDWSKDKAEKIFAAYGYNVSGGGTAAMGNDTTQAHLQGFRPDTGVYCCDELQLVYLNDDDSNNDLLVADTTAMAGALAINNLQPRTYVVKGFYAIELTGRVNEIRYNQSEAKTVIIADGWSAASGGTL